MGNRLKNTIRTCLEIDFFCSTKAPKKEAGAVHRVSLKTHLSEFAGGQPARGLENVRMKWATLLNPQRALISSTVRLVSTSSCFVLFSRKFRM